MAINYEAETLDGLPDDIKSHYVERNGKFVLDLITPDGVSVEDTGGLKRALAAERKTAAELKKQIAAYGDATPDQVQTALETLERFETEGMDAEGKAKAAWERKEAALTEKFGRDLKQREEALAALRGENDNLMLGQAISEAAREHGGNKFLPMWLRERSRVIEHEGKRLVAVVGDDGEPMFSDEPGNNRPMSVAELTKKAKGDPDNGPLFNSNGAAGSGASGSAAGRTGAGRIDPSLPPSARRQMARQQAGG